MNRILTSLGPLGARRRGSLYAGRLGRFWVSVLGCGLLGAVVTAGIGGCGGKTEPPPRPLVAPTPPPSPQVVVPTPAAAPKPPPKPEKLPDNVADWKFDDYRRARLELDSHLKDGVVYLGKKHAGHPEPEPAEKAAGLLTELLKYGLPKPPAKPETPPATGAAASTKPPAGQAPGAAPSVAPGPTAGVPAAGPATAPQPAAPLPPPYKPLDTGTIQAICEALAGIATKTAVATLGEVIAGRFKTDNNKVAAEASVDGVVRHRALSPQYEAWIFRLLTAPDEVRPAAVEEPATPTPAVGVPPGPQGSKVTAAELQVRAFELIRKDASEQLRLQLALHLVKPGTPVDQRRLMGKFLMGPDFRNLSAQVVIYGSPLSTKADKAKLEEYFLYHSSETLALLLGTAPKQIVRPTEGPPGGEGPSTSGFGFDNEPARPGNMIPPRIVPGGPAGVLPTGRLSVYDSNDPELPYRVAGQLWSEGFAKSLADRLESVESLAADTTPILLAATIPTNAMRAKLSDFLSAHAGESPKGLQTAGLGKLQTEPGLLLLLKTLPRKDPPPAQPGGPGMIGPGNERTKPAKRYAAKQPVPAVAATDHDQVPQEWMAACNSLLRTMCDQFAVGGKAQAAERSKHRRDAPAGRPLDAPGSLEQVNEYLLFWPDDVPGKEKMAGAALDPFKVRYVRLEGTMLPKTVLIFYRRKHPHAVEHPIPGGVWLESFQAVPDTDRKLSVDILITRPRPAGNQPQPGVVSPADHFDTTAAGELVVEYLAIDATVPTAARESEPTGADDPAAAKPAAPGKAKRAE